MKLAVIGDGSTDTPELVSGLSALDVAVLVVHDIADEVRRRAAAGSWIVDFTNPVGIVTRALLDHGHRAVGL